METKGQHFLEHQEVPEVPKNILLLFPFFLVADKSTNQEGTSYIRENVTHSLLDVPDELKQQLNQYVVRKAPKGFSTRPLLKESQ